jgi:hypothetical protein
MRDQVANIDPSDIDEVHPSVWVPSRYLTPVRSLLEAERFQETLSYE